MITGPAADRPGGAPLEVRVAAGGLVERGDRVVLVTTDDRRWLPKLRRGNG